MSTTTFHFTASDFLQHNTGTTWLQAFYTWDNGNYGNPIDLKSNGSGSLTVNDGGISGRIYIVGGSGTPQSFSQEGDITANASTGQYRYVIYELNLGNANSDVLDITAENGIGFNASAESKQTVGSNLFSGSKLPLSSLTSLITSPPISNSAAVQDGMLFGPNGAPGENYWPASYWTNPNSNYVGHVLTTPSVINDIEIGGVDGGQIYHYRAYATSYGGQAGMMLYPVDSTAGAGSQFSDWLFVPTDTLANNIFQPGLGGYLVTDFSGPPQDATTTTTTHLMTTTTTTAAIVEEALLAGFNAGFYGSFGTSPNPNVTQKLDLNKGWNIGWNYAYQGQLNSVPPGYGTNMGSLAVGSVFNHGSANGLHSGFYDPYAAMVMQNTNVYGWAYGDYLGSFGGTPPVISLWDPNRLGTGQGSNVSDVYFTIYGDGTQQPATNFIAPAVGYIAPSGATFAPAIDPTNNLLQFNFSVAGFSPDQNTPITFRIYAPGEEGVQNIDSQGFINLQLNGLYQANDNFSDWANYTIAGSTDTAYTVAATGAENPGYLQIFNVPVVTGVGSTPGLSWYQLVLGNGDDATTYNIYAAANSSGAYTQMIVDQSAYATSLAPVGPGEKPLSLSAPGSTPTTQALVNQGQYITFDPAVFSAPHMSRFSGGPLQDDVIIGDANGGTLARWTLDGQGDVVAGESGPLNASVLPGWQVAGTGNFGGGTDLLMESVNAAGITSLATWTVSGLNVTPNSPFGTLPLGYSVVGTGDFIGAGQANQILLQYFDQSTNLNQLAFWQVINGALSHHGNVGGPLGNGWHVAGVGNILGDGRSDVLLQKGLKLAIWEFNEHGAVTQHADINMTIAPGHEVVGLGYFTNNTHEDILFQKGGQLGMWQMQGFDVLNHGSVGAPLLPGWAIAGFGDYDNSGTTDILLQKGDQFAEWQMSGRTVTNIVTVGSDLSAGWNLVGTGILG